MELGVPADLNRWQLRDTLLAITRTGGTAIGDLLPGSRAVELALADLEEPADAVAIEGRPARYSAWADAALEGEEIGSSPGGEQPKFTSTVTGAHGRRGFVSLLALDAAFVGSGGHDWALAGERLAALGWVDADTAAQMGVLHWFGRLIGNSDMHPGNLGFHFTDAGM